DSLNPHILKGTVPWQLRFLAYESLMGRSWDEPFTLYGLLAESVETGPNREWVEFTLRPEARFSDGSPVTIEDVMWSYETLGTEGHPRYRGTWSQIESMEQTGPRSVRFTFNTDDRELALIIGMRPIMKKAQWDGRDFASSGLDVVPVSSAPYVIESYEAGRYVTLRRDPDYWGRDLPFMKGQANLDEIRMEFFGDGTVQFEAFKAGELNAIRENNAEKWLTQYDFPAVQRGDVVKSEIGHGRPTGMTGFVMNTRHGAFADWRVRDAMMHAFNFEYINETMTGSRQPRITSYFSNSELGMSHGPAEGRVREMLEPFADDLLPGALDGYTVPEGVMKNAAGQPFSFEIVLAQGSGEEQSIIDIFVQALTRMGISPRVTVIDAAQYNERINAFDFDMTFFRRGISLSPGNEQRLYWGSEAADNIGSRNLMGMKSEAADAMIDTLLNATSQEDFIA
ncbi:ABC transporter substrate-binding protein, partial [Salipiger sp. HF18]|uniref:extracellular solute-binding protein n=1 Tax=Salipiger sp. HF18 TaxID=2721557 RepID=UPI00142E0C09